MRLACQSHAGRRGGSAVRLRARTNWTRWRRPDPGRTGVGCTAQASPLCRPRRSPAARRARARACG